MQSLIESRIKETIDVTKDRITNSSEFWAEWNLDWIRSVEEYSKIWFLLEDYCYKRKFYIKLFENRKGWMGLKNP